MEHLFISGILAFAFTLFTIPIIIRIANDKNLTDHPDERKIHKTPIPALGGIGIFIGFAVCVSIFANFKDAPEFQYYMAAALVLFILGIKDDLVAISARVKFIGQVFAASIIMFKGNLLLTSMHGAFGIHNMEIMYQYALTMFAIIVIINAYNLIDGVDGLAGSIGLITSVVFSYLFLRSGNMPYAIMGFTLSSAILAFLVFNFSPAKIFMGDTGSMLLGFVNTILALKFIEECSKGSFVTAGVVSSAAPAIGFGVMLLPLMDTLRVFGVRLLNGKSPFNPDRNHIHHLLLDRGMNHMSVTLTLAGLNTFFIALAFLAQGLGPTYIILGLITIFFILIAGLYITKRRNHLRIIKNDVNPNSTKPVKKQKLVSLFSKQTAAAEED